ncbi:hypothetical protein GCM10009719_31020 [Nocardioides kribbensis]
MAGVGKWRETTPAVAVDRSFAATFRARRSGGRKAAARGGAGAGGARGDRLCGKWREMTPVAGVDRSYAATSRAGRPGNARQPRVAGPVLAALVVAERA